MFVIFSWWWGDGCWMSGGGVKGGAGYKSEGSLREPHISRDTELAKFLFYYSSEFENTL